MPKNNSVPFEELFSIPLRNGLTRPKAIRGSGTKMINMGELFSFSRIENIHADRVPLSEKEESYLLEDGDLLFARQSLVLSGAGKCSIFMGDSEPVTYEGHIIRVRLNKEIANPFFYYYFFNSPIGRSTIEGIVEQVAAAGIRGSDLSKLNVPHIPLPEQRAIAGILGALDDKIELNRRMNRTLESITRAVFRQWFVEGEDIVDWKMGRLGDFIEVNERSINKDNSNDEIEYIDISSVSVGHLEGTTIYALKDAPSRARRLVRHGDTIWSTVRPNRKSYLFIYQPKENLVVSTGFAVLTPKKIPPSFLYFFTTTEQFIDYLVSNADGSAYPAVLPERFADADLPLPPKDMLNEFERVASPLLRQIAHNEKESRTLASLRDSLLPKLMRGEVRVSEL